MPLEVRELVVKVNVGATDAAAARPLDEARLDALKAELVATCLAELRQQLTRRQER